MAAYGFEEASGTVATDASGNGNSGTVSGASWGPGRFGQALHFDGVDDVVVVGDSKSLDLTTGMTIEAWVYPTAPLSGWKAIAQKEVDAYFLNANTAGDHVGVGGTFAGGCCTILDGASPLTPDRWTHVAGTYDGAMLRLYVDGLEVASQGRTGHLEVNGSPLRLGGNTYATEFFPGWIDEVRIYDRALTESEIQSDMSTPVAEPLPPSPPPRTRVETILFVDGPAGPSQPAGFRLHLGSHPGVYTSVVDIGMPPAGRTGVRAYTVEVDREATPYVALTSYDAAGRTSGLSNEIDRPPRRPAFDHDGRGTSDLLLLDPSRTSLQLARSDGTTSVAAPGIPPPEQATIAVQADFDGDGITDVLWSREGTGELILWLLGPGGALRTAELLPAPGDLVLRGSGDLDGDANADLVFETPVPGSLVFWFMEGAANRDRAVLAGPSRQWSLVGIGEVDGDRRADLVWRHSSSGRVDVWRMNGASVLEEVAFPVGKAWEALGLGDYDGDGAADLVLRHLSDGRLESLSILDGAVTGAPLTAVFPHRTGLALGRDFDDDGFADLVGVDPFQRVAQLQLIDPTGPGRFLEIDLAQTALPGDLAREIGDRDNDWNPDYCDGDFNNDGVVGYPDLRRTEECFDHYEIGACSGLDVDRDGVIGVAELLVVQRGFGARPCSNERTP